MSRTYQINERICVCDYVWIYDSPGEGLTARYVNNKIQCPKSEKPRKSTPPQGYHTSRLIH